MSISWAGQSVTDNPYVSYNSVVIDNAVKVELETTPVWDSTNRIVVYRRTVYTISGVVHASGSSTDASLDELQSKLTIAGRPLIIRNCGCGEINLDNYFGPMRDVEFGPKPQMISWAPIAGKNAATVVFRLTVNLPRCPLLGSNATGVPYEITYEQTWEYGKFGEFTRTISGQMKLWNAHYNGVLINNADQYRELLTINYPLRSERIVRRFSESTDQSTLSFLFVDKEILSRHPLPVGMAEANGTYSVQVIPGAEANTASLSMSMKSLYYYHPIIAWNVFAQYYHQYTRGFGYYNTILTSLEMSEELWGLGVDFSMSWQFASSIRNVLRASGFLWTSININRPPYVSLNWNDWHASMSYGQYAVRSYTGYGCLPQTIFDPCLSQGGGNGGTGQNQSSQGQGQPSNQGSSQDDDVADQTVPPNPDSTWLEYSVHVVPKVAHNFSQAQYVFPGRLPDDSPTGPNDVSPFTLRSVVPESNQNIRVPDILGYHGSTFSEVVFYGRIRRYHYPIPRPRLLFAAGSATFEKTGVYDLSTERVVEQGKVVHVMDFSVTYGLVSPPTTGWDWPERWENPVSTPANTRP